MMATRVGVVGAAIVMGLLSARVLFGGTAANMVPWAVLALCTSLLARSGREARTNGGIFGFAVSAAFLWFDNTDAKTLSRIEVLVPVIFAASLFGLLCGAVLGWAGWRLRRVAGLGAR